jgi:hypothetical protein
MIVDRDNVGMMQAGGCASFLEEASDEGGLANGDTADDLERDIAIELRVSRSVDDGIVACADFLEDLVSTQSCHLVHHSDLWCRCGTDSLMPDFITNSTNMRVGENKGLAGLYCAGGQVVLDCAHLQRSFLTMRAFSSTMVAAG